MEENVKKQLDQIGDLIDAKLEKAHGQALESATGKADEMLKSEISNLANKFNERLDEMEVANKKHFEAKANENLSFKGGLVKSINEGAIENLVKGNSRSASFQVKADMTVGADFTGEVIPADRVPGYKFDPTRPVHIRQLIPQGSTSSDVIRFVKESGYSNGAATAAEGATLAQSDFDMTASDSNVRKIGTEEYKIHLDEGGIEVDGKSVETSIMEFFDSDDYHESNEAKLEKLEHTLEFLKKCWQILHSLLAIFQLELQKNY